ncbi:rhomboid family protein [Solitalea koreensis]|uniref:Membrane associated serine protease, rhomboid family n=1 Tax=Solitalea koreensis TaxID=543615 RepID=A0A521CRS2_9SPHI|nr:rhomboid family intramembrane serine protease [Solitalea koreensis]SMO62157.1 Membrane associated serine protease, rhomboid family [Solitalea koreensis]
MNITEEIKQVFIRPRKVLHQFIAVNVGVFFIIQLLKVVELLFSLPVNISTFLIQHLSLPSSLNTLLTQPWSLFTYMFLHANLLHLLFNMLGLYWFGQVVEEFLGSKKFRWIYLLGGVIGGILFIAAYNVFPLFAEIKNSSTILGASAGVMAIVVAAATLVPNFPFMLLLLGEVRIKYIAFFYILFDLISIASANAGGHISHLGGALLGFTYISQMRSGESSFFSNIGKKITSVFSGKSKMKVAYKNTDAKNKKRAANANRQEVIDKILDKISKTGYEGLSREEKEILFKASQEKE